MTDNEIISAVKSKFKSYHFNTLCRVKIELQLDEINSLILNYKTSPIVIPSGTVSHDPHKSSKLEAKREKLEARRAKYMQEVDPINKFLSSLPEVSSKILMYRYFSNDILTYAQISNLLPISETSFKRLVNNLCLEFWTTVHRI